MIVEQKQEALFSGEVKNLYIKAKHGSAPVELAPGESLTCVDGLGLAGDIHAHRLSPRQILITLQSQLIEFSIAPGELHENMVIATSFAEHFRPGAALLTAGGVEIKLTMYCEPCKRIRMAVPDLAQIVHRRGILGYVIKGGEIRRHDSFKLLPNRYAPLPESISQKFVDFVAAIPRGRVVRYLDVTVGMGVAQGFVRAIPGYIKRNGGKGLPMHRIVSGQGNLLDYLPDQALKLLAEGVEVSRFAHPGTASVALQRYLWKG